MQQKLNCTYCNTESIPDMKYHGPVISFYCGRCGNILQSPALLPAIGELRLAIWEAAGKSEANIIAAKAACAFMPGFNGKMEIVQYWKLFKQVAV